VHEAVTVRGPVAESTRGERHTLAIAITVAALVAAALVALFWR